MPDKLQPYFMICAQKHASETPETTKEEDIYRYEPMARRMRKSLP